MITLRIVGRHFRKYVGLFVIAVGCVLGYSVLNGVSILSIIPLIDRVLGGKDIVLPQDGIFPFRQQLVDFVAFLNAFERMRLLVALCIFIVVVFLFKGVFQYFQKVLMQRIGLLLVKDLRVELYKKLQSLSVAYFARKRTGELMSRINNDVILVKTCFSSALSDILIESGQVVMYLTMIVMLDPFLASVVLITSGFLVWPISYFGRKLRRITIKAQEKIADINSLMLEAFMGIRIVKAFSMQDYEQRRFEEENIAYTSIMIKAAKKEAIISPLIEFLAIVSAVVILIYGSWKVIEGRTTLSVFIMVIALMSALLKPVRRIGKMVGIIQRSFAALKRMDDIFGETPHVEASPNPVTLSSFKESIVFDNVSFSYDGGECVLKDIAFQLQRGQIVAVVGPSGAGKTTLANLLLRFYDPTDGRIIVDGIDVRDLHISTLRGLVGLVTQDMILFNDSIRNNIAYGMEETAFSRVQQAAVAANADTFINEMELTYDTLVGERGVKLSGGQKQRLTIARALLKNPPILILDEATSSLDTQAERAVQTAIDHLMEGRTVFVIAHRLSTIQHADMILVMDKGCIVQQGKHKELIVADGLYKRLYDMQFMLV